MTREEERLFEITVYNLYMATLLGSNPDRANTTVGALYKRMTDKRIGDVVVEISTIWDEKRVGKRVGRLRIKQREPYHTEEDWAKMHEDYEGDPGPRTERMVWHIELASGEVITWDNCEFVAVPPEIMR